MDGNMIVLVVLVFLCTSLGCWFWIGHADIGTDLTWGLVYSWGCGTGSPHVGSKLISRG